MKIWITLIALTLLTFSLGYFELLNPFVIGIVLATIIIKGQLIIDNFMGLKKVTLKYRIIPLFWLSSVVFLIAIAYYIPINE